MPKYLIFSGMSGSFGGAHYRFTAECADENEANKLAYDEAVKEYQSYEGYHGILSREECQEIVAAEYENYTEDDVEDYYRKEIEGWIEYYVKIVSGKE